MDSDAGARALLAEGAWLQRLARSLVDEAAAEEVVQETYAAALAARPEADRPLAPWLATVLRNFARLQRRAAGRRARGERRAAEREAPAAATAEELLIAGEQRRIVAGVVEALPEPYRATLLLCYAEGLTPSEIARRQQIPAATVRARLRRGLALTRARLDRSGDRRRAVALAWRRPWAWVAPLAGALMAVGTVTVQRVPGRAPVASGHPASLRVLALDRQRALAALAHAALPVLAAAATAGERPAQREDLVAECLERRQRMDACQQMLADGEVAPEAPDRERRRQEWLQRFRAGNATSVCTAPRQDGLVPTRAQIDAARACWAIADCAAALACGQDVYAWAPPPGDLAEPAGPEPAGAVAGRVVDEEGAPLVQVRVLLESGRTAITRATFSDQDGRFVFPSLRAGAFLLSARAPGFEAPLPDDLAVPAGARVERDVTLEREGDPLRDPTP
jgi:RNA polymerase sigma factor (sigma-70 family)